MRLFLAAFGALALAACETTVAQPADPSPVSITLERTACFGACPVYTVSIDGDGAVSYTGRRFVGVTGEQHGQVSRADVQTLLQAFDAAQFETLQDEYRAHITDQPSRIITLTRNGHTKRVVDYAGTRAGMPEAVRALEDEIDRVANTAQWVHRPDGAPAK
ncbi:MAG TPA: DUF6438 domain-containing protein [Vitreimonas sp.]|nr:DUF6438 domain-containing protein [Vitreimonas sp.]